MGPGEGAVRAGGARLQGVPGGAAQVTAGETWRALVPALHAPPVSPRSVSTAAGGSAPSI